MLRIILPRPRLIPPFCEPARELRIQNTPLWLWQRNLASRYTDRELVAPPDAGLPHTNEPCLVYADNLFFDHAFLEAFVAAARHRGRPARAALSFHDPAFRENALPLSTSFTPADDVYLADLWYFPEGPTAEAEPLMVDLRPREVGYYHVPTYMADLSGDLVFQVPLRALMAIDSWVHVVLADVVFGVLARGARFEDRLRDDSFFKLSILARAMLEARQVLECSSLVSVGRNCVVDPTAVIHGPTSIGDNVVINAGAVIDNCIIGSNVNISQGVQLMLSVVGDGAFLPFGAGLFMSTMMENSMVAQNTCLQLSVIGRNTFVGAGSTFTDYNLIPKPLRAVGSDGDLRPSARPVMGAAIGHNCRLGSGLIVYPSRTIESDVVLLGPRTVERDVRFEDSDHHSRSDGNLHHVQYHPHLARPHQTW